MLVQYLSGVLKHKKLHLIKSDAVWLNRPEVNLPYTGFLFSAGQHTKRHIINTPGLAFTDITEKECHKFSIKYFNNNYLFKVSQGHIF